MIQTVSQRFDPAGFAAYVAMLDFEPGGFKPDMVVLHNTAVPSLAQRPDGFTQAHMANLAGYYSGLGWKGGPHLFVDDHGIWVFNPLDKRGTHSPSWNSHAWGVEMLGDYDKEPFVSGRGATVRRYAVFAVAELLAKIGKIAADVKFHKEDPKTDHDCPGKHVDKSDFLASVAAVMHHDGAVLPHRSKPCKIVFYRKGHGHEPAGVIEGELRDDGKAYASAKALGITTGIRSETQGPVAVAEFLKARYSLSFDPVARKVYAVEK